MELVITGVAILVVILLLCFYYFYQISLRERHERDCFDAMLKMILQPTQNNITALEELLKQRRINEKTRSKLLYEAELEADCLSIMPTGEIRSSQPFLQQRYSQIIATTGNNGAVYKLVKSRLTNFKAV